MKTLLAYASKYGTTKEISNTLSEMIEGEVSVYDVKVNSDIDIDIYDKVIVASPIYMGGVQKEVKNFCTKHKSELMSKDLFIMLCSKFEDQKSFETNFDSELLKHSKTTKFVGSALDMKKLSFIERGISKALKATDYNDIKEEEIKQLADLINGVI